MAAEKAVEKISGLQKVSKSLKSVENILERVKASGKAPENDHFEALMRQRKVEKSTVESGKGGAKSSLMDEVRNANQKLDGAKRSPEDLVTHTQEAIRSIGAAKEKLEIPGFPLKGSVQNILRSKLTNIEESLRVALSKAGVEPEAREKPTGLMNPIQP